MYHSTCALGKVVREYSVANSGSVKVTLETNSNEDTADGSMKKTTATNVSDGDTGTLREASVSGDVVSNSPASSELSLL